MPDAPRSAGGAKGGKGKRGVGEAARGRWRLSFGDVPKGVGEGQQRGKEGGEGVIGLEWS